MSVSIKQYSCTPSIDIHTVACIRGGSRARGQSGKTRDMGCGASSPGLPAVHTAAKEGNIEALKQILDSHDGSLEVNRKTVVRAGQVMRIAHVRRLTCSSPSVPSPQVDRTPLMCAAEHGHLDCVKLLLDRGARVNEKMVVRRARLSLPISSPCLHARLHCGCRALCTRGSGRESGRERLASSIHARRRLSRRQRRRPRAERCRALF